MKLTSFASAFTGIKRVALIALSAGLITSAWAKPVPANLGYGLDKLVESDLMLKADGAKKGMQLYNGYATQQAAAYAERAITNADGRFKVDITLSGKVTLEELRASLQQKFPSFEVTSVDPTYRRSGIIEGWLSVEESAAVAQMPGVRSVFLALKPRLNSVRNSGVAETKDRVPKPGTPPAPNFAMLGTKFLQGITQHRVDKINQFYNPAAPVNYDGEGITIAVMSDSFGSNAAQVATNVANFDLPGAAGNPMNTTPVVVLEDAPGNTDEGRGMAEIVYKMAPKAKIGFATAAIGEVSFANNIRALSGQFPSVPNTQPGFKADVIADDVSWPGEPVFADGGIVMNGVDDVTAVGVSYFSSAANSYGVSVYNSDLRIVPNGIGVTAATNTALVGTNIDLTGVPPELYQGGFHNFNPASQDVACRWTVANGGASIEMQWDDPYDTEPPAVNQPAIFSSTGTVGATPVDFTGIAMNAPQQYVIFVTATPGQPTDAVVSLIRQSDNKVIVRQDTGLDEIVNFFPPTAGLYTVRVERFDATSGGGFTIDVFTGNDAPVMTTDLNILAFNVTTGAYVPGSSFTSNNLANNRPVEIGTTFGVGGQLQFVIARSAVPTAPRPATRVRLGTDANGNSANAPAEYYDYNSAVTSGHSIAAGCNGVGAYDVFRPNVPQNFTSGGPALIYFDRNQNLKPNAPEVRLQPRLSAANGSNSIWSGGSGESANDIDTGGFQFYGTSAASPHAAGVGALVLDAHGGPGSVTPAQMRSILQTTTYPHDLDPYQATGVARASNGGKVSVTIRSDNTATAARGRNDPNAFSIAYVGPSNINTFVFNPNGLPSEGGGVTSGQNGVDASNNYFSNVTPGLYFALAGTGGFAFTQGTHTGLTTTDVAVPLLDAPAPLPAPAGNGRRLTLTFLNNAFGGGDIFRFTIGRGLERGPNVATAGGAALANYNADLFGGGVLIPESTVIPGGMRFSGTLADGATFNGFMQNRLGAGFSQLDGYGFINAEQAVAAPLP